MNKIIVKNLPSACEYCWALDERGDESLICRITGQTKKDNFDHFTWRMERCPMVSLNDSVIRTIDENCTLVCDCLDPSFYSDYIKEELTNFCSNLVNDIRRKCTEN